MGGIQHRPEKVYSLIFLGLVERAKVMVSLLNSYGFTLADLCRA